MKAYDKLYIDGAWVAPSGKGTLDVINSTTEEVMATIPEGDASDVDRAVKAAKAAFPAWSQTSVQDRAKFLSRINEGLTLGPTRSRRHRLRRSGHAEDAVQADPGGPAARQLRGRTRSSPRATSSRKRSATHSS